MKRLLALALCLTLCGVLAVCGRADAALAEALPTDSYLPGEIQAGDLLLYGEDWLVLLGKNLESGYRYTPLGRLETVNGLAEAVVSDETVVTFVRL